MPPKGYDDLTPPVCICDSPRTLPCGECLRCRRPYKPGVFDDLRATWRTRLLEAA